jgi:hypothetical protein
VQWLRAARALFSWHGVQGKASSYFSGADSAMTYNKELDRNKCDEQYETDDVVAPNYELAKGFNYAPRCANTFASMKQDAPAGGEIERKPE